MFPRRPHASKQITKKYVKFGRAQASGVFFFFINIPYPHATCRILFLVPLALYSCACKADFRTLGGAYIARWTSSVISVGIGRSSGFARLPLLTPLETHSHQKKKTPEDGWATRFYRLHLAALPDGIEMNQDRRMIDSCPWGSICIPRLVGSPGLVENQATCPRWWCHHLVSKWAHIILQCGDEQPCFFFFSFFSFDMFQNS